MVHADCFCSLIFTLLDDTSVTTVTTPRANSGTVRPSIIARASTGTRANGISLGITSMPALRQRLTNVNRSGTGTVITCHRDGNPFASISRLLRIGNVNGTVLREGESGLRIGWSQWIYGGTSR